MATVEAFKGIRYSLDDGVDISDRIAPPYDVLSESDKQALLARSPYNIVAIDLPHTPPKTAGPEECYRKAGELFSSWLDDGVMIRDDEPMIYLYQQRFVYNDKEYVRRGFVARLKIEEFGKGSVYPHEKTYGGPKEDRLLLTKYTRANISQVFCLFDDETNEITNGLYNRAKYPPTYKGELDSVVNEVWALGDRELCHWLTQQMANRKILIADGHHRYDTSRMYRDYLRETENIDETHPANYVGCMFVSMSEPGLAILPTHRCIFGMSRLKLDELADCLADKFDISLRDDIDSGEKLESVVGELGDSCLAFFKSDDDRVLLACPKDVDGLLSELAGDYIAEWRKLGVSILHYYVLDKVVYPKWLESNEPTIEYLHLADETFDFTKSHNDVLGVYVPATPIEAMRKISLAGQLMPQKSTFFYPKLATGLVIHPLF